MVFRAARLSGVDHKNRLSAETVAMCRGQEPSISNCSSSEDLRAMKVGRAAKLDDSRGARSEKEFLSFDSTD